MARGSWPRFFGLLALQGSAALTVWSGVYTPAQAARGKEAYEKSCQHCHAGDLSGGIEGGESVPALRRDGFGVSRRDLNNLYTFIKDEMPRDDPASLDQATYVDIVAYLLQQNGFPSGSQELPPDQARLRSIAIVRTP